MSARILLLEDDAVFASELSRALAEIGCDVTVVNEGNEGLASIEELTDEAMA